MCSVAWKYRNDSRALQLVLAHLPLSFPEICGQILREFNSFYAMQADQNGVVSLLCPRTRSETANGTFYEYVSVQEDLNLYKMLSDP